MMQRVLLPNGVILITLLLNLTVLQRLQFLFYYNINSVYIIHSEVLKHTCVYYEQQHYCRRQCHIIHNTNHKSRSIFKHFLFNRYYYINNISLPMFHMCSYPLPSQIFATDSGRILSGRSGLAIIQFLLLSVITRVSHFNFLFLYLIKCVVTIPKNFYFQYSIRKP